jgi:2-haloacid dehalogenase
MQPTDLEALMFDVFGTVVDFRTGIIREGRAMGAARGIQADWERCADLWRDQYQPLLSQVRDGQMPWANLDALHRMGLENVLAQMGIAGLSEADLAHLAKAWHRLDPWPDSVPGMLRLRRRYILATMSNGNVALLVHMARRAGLPWDAILGAEPARAYKPQPRCYLYTAELLALPPARIMLVAAHPSDLEAARALGFRTGYVHRPHEFGPKETKPMPAPDAFDIVTDSMEHLADKLGC